METGGTNETCKLTHGIFLGPGTSCFLIAGSLSFIEVCNFWYKRVIRVGVGKEGADRQENFRDCQSRAPLLLQNVQAYTSIRVNVWVVHLGLKVDLRRLERIVRREMDFDKKDATRIGAVSRAHDCRLPVKQIFANGPCTARCRWVFLQIQQFFLNPFARHFRLRSKGQ
jgi:hypothetical protein